MNTVSNKEGKIMSIQINLKREEGYKIKIVYFFNYHETFQNELVQFRDPKAISTE